MRDSGRRECKIEVRVWKLRVRCSPHLSMRHVTRVSPAARLIFDRRANWSELQAAAMKQPDLRFFPSLQHR